MLWPLVALAMSGLGWDAWRKFLARETTTVRALTDEMRRRDEDFSKRFAFYEKAHDGLVTRFNAANPSPNPLGKSYSTQRPG